ncbi:hypothetical protein HYH02_011514 [Chlamydomonas schloesseri]|uniref:Uncharacterized protein n=1 Tax=Chlamydomonas schloesseri TaxID=2026947 RepID=A0A835T3Y4_9CHLO|nr:hypothetical protein HYH02_011514 [Chlamydomonas schloesseri]|eukprot:KAG2436577.1 hypothetical protein HYH02_011514 [Chlamydomonas schloesseri]
MFFRRDETLQRLLTTPGIPEGEEAAEPVVEEEAEEVEGNERLRQTARAGSARVPYLPSWDIVRSALWLQLEAGLMQVVALEQGQQLWSPPPQQEAAVAAVGGGGHAASVVGATAHAAADCRRAATLQRHATSTLLGAVPEEDEDEGERVEGLESGSATAAAAAVASPAARCYSRTHSTGRAACAELPHPRGLGDVPLTPRGGGGGCGGGGASGAQVGSVMGAAAAAFGRATTLLRGRGRGSSIVAAALPAAAVEYATAATADEPHHHVAFAVGLAAATTANAAVNSVGDLAVAGLTAVASTALGAVSSAALQQLGPHALAAGSNMLVNRIQSIIVKKTSASAIDAALGAASASASAGSMFSSATTSGAAASAPGSNASATTSGAAASAASAASSREALNQRLRATMLGMSVMWFLLNLGGMQDSLAHLDFQHDFVHSVKTMIDLASSGPGFMENCRELLQIGFSVGVNLSARNGGAGGAGIAVAGAATAASAAAGMPAVGGGGLDLMHGMVEGLQAVQSVAAGILG